MKGSERHKEKQKIKKAKKEANKKIMRFYLIFPLLFLIIFIFYSFFSTYFETEITMVSSWTAGLLGFILNLFGMNARTSGPLLSLNKFSISVVAECTGLFEMFIFLAVILAFPANYKKKLQGLLFGILLLYNINLIRMIMIIVLANWNPKTFKFLHLYFWQVAEILIIGGIWLFWVEKIVKYERETPDIYT